MRKWILAGSTIALIATCAVAQRGQRLPAECRKEVVQLCGMNREAIHGCLKGKSSLLSDACRSDLREMVAARAGEGRSGGAVAQDGQELSYGSDAKQKLDYFAVTGKSEAPLVIYIHGGGWSIGDKNRGADIKSKYYNGLGNAIASFLAALG